MKPNRNRARDIGFYALLAIIVIAVVFTINQDTKPNTIESYSELADLFESEKVQSFKTEGSTILLEIRTGDPYEPTIEKTYDLYSFSVFYEDFHELIAQQHRDGILEKYDYTEGFTLPWWASFVPYLIIMFGAMALWYFMMNRAGGGGGIGGLRADSYHRAPGRF